MEQYKCSNHNGIIVFKVSTKGILGVNFSILARKLLYLCVLTDIFASVIICNKAAGRKAAQMRRYTFAQSA